MRKIWNLRLAASLAGAVWAVGCAGGDKGETRAAQDAESSMETISLSGCLSVAPDSANEIALQNVRMAPLAEQPSDAPTLTSKRQVITEGSWVRVTMGEDNAQLRDHLGQRVSIVGRIADDGRDTIGTSGPRAGAQEPEPRADPSRAAEPEHHSEKVRKEAGPIGQQWLSTGTSPQVIVHRIERSGEPCHQELAPANRR